MVIERPVAGFLSRAIRPDFLIRPVSTGIKIQWAGGIGHRVAEEDEIMRVCERSISIFANFWYVLKLDEYRTQGWSDRPLISLSAKK